MRNKHSYVDRLNYMHMLEDGYSVHQLHIRYGIDESQLSVLWSKYQSDGPSGLEKGKNVKADGTLKKIIVNDIEENHLTLPEASLKYGTSPSRLRVWLKLARSQGLDVLDITSKRGRPKGMEKSKKKKTPQTELEKLQKENLRLRIENELLKKVKALVEKREARLYAIGRKPSRN